MIKSTNWRRDLREALMKHFNESDIRQICFDLGVDFEKLSGDNKVDLVISLIEEFNNQGKIPELIQACSMVRENVSWDQIAAAEKEEKESKSFKLPQAVSFSPSSRELKPQIIGIAVVVVLVVIIGAYFAFRPDTSESTSLSVTDTPPTQPTLETAATSISLIANATDESTPVATEVLPTPIEALPTPTEVLPTPTEVLPTPTEVPPTPTDEPTSGPQVEDAAQIEPTIVYPDGQRLELVYDSNSFYLYNPSADRISVRSISFEAVDNGGRPLYSMAGDLWANVYNFVDGRACYAIEPFGVDGPPLNPGFCLKENARETPTKDDNIVFWTERPGSVEFRVLWENKEIARCSLVTKEQNSCEVYVPVP
jgi:hypothetical protein